MKCVPIIGVNATDVPMANPPAILCEVSELRISRKYA